MMNKQEIAKAINKIDWEDVQCDYPNENNKVIDLRLRLIDLNKAEIISVLLSVIEAKHLTHKAGTINSGIFSDLNKFEKLKD